jgi:signal transduction histidine kinase
MSRSLFAKLIAAFLVVGVVGAVLTTLFARWTTLSEFDQLVQEQVRSNFVSSAAAYYRANGSWQGALDYFPSLDAAATIPLPPDGARPLGPAPADQGYHQPLPRSSYVFALADIDGRIVLPAGSYRLDEQVSDDVIASGIEVMVDGQVVGIALLTGQSPELSVQERQYLARTNRSSLYAALAAILVALALGVLLARTLMRPLRELTAATHAMAGGELDQRVPVRSRDELGELAASFNQMSTDLARSVELRQQMMADIAHDLRTPLTVLAGYLEALRDGVLLPSPERFETMHVEAQHLRRLIEDLRTLSLADAGELTLNREVVPPTMILEQAAAAHRHQAEELGIALDVSVEPGVPDIRVDPDRMAQVLGNLVDNALRYTSEGGHLRLAAARKEGRVLLSVQDDGEGIAPERLSRLFDRFYREDESRGADEAGSGLGLAIARSLVQLHGGDISAESTLGEGTTFTVAIPVAS